MERNRSRSKNSCIDKHNKTTEEGQGDNTKQTIHKAEDKKESLNTGSKIKKTKSVEMNKEGVENNKTDIGGKLKELAKNKKTGKSNNVKCAPNDENKIRIHSKEKNNIQKHIKCDTKTNFEKSNKKQRCVNNFDKGVGLKSKNKENDKGEDALKIKKNIVTDSKRKHENEDKHGSKKQKKSETTQKQVPINNNKVDRNKKSEKPANDVESNIKLANKKKNRTICKIKFQKTNKSVESTNLKGRNDKDEAKTNINTIKKHERLDNKSKKQQKTDFKKTKDTHKVNIQKNKLSSLEREMLTNGTKKDQIDVLTLIIEKNPTNCIEEFSQLLEMAQNERNDTVFSILKNIKDLLCSKLVFTPEFTRQKRKLVSTLEYYLKNQFIKSKVIYLIYTLLAKDILFIDLIYIFINKLGDKKETSNVIVKYIEKLYMLDLHRDIIKFGLEELYQRDIKARKKILETMNKIAKYDSEPGKLNLLFYQTLKNKDYADKTRFEKTLENVLLTFIKDITVVEEENFDETLILQDYKLQSLNFTILLFLYKSKSKSFHQTLMNYVRKDKMLGYKEMVAYMNLLHEFLTSDIDETKKYNLVESLLSGATLYDDNYIQSLLIIVSKLILDKSDVYSSLHVIGLYERHSNPVIRLLTMEILQKKVSSIFNPFDNEENKRMQLIADSSTP